MRQGFSHLLAARQLAQCDRVAQNGPTLLQPPSEKPKSTDHNVDPADIAQSHHLDRVLQCDCPGQFHPMPAIEFSVRAVVDPVSQQILPLLKILSTYRLNGKVLKLSMMTRLTGL